MPIGDNEGRISLTNKDRLIKLENDITLLRGEILQITELLKKVIEQTKKEEPSGWLFS